MCSAANHGAITRITEIVDELGDGLHVTDTALAALVRGTNRSRISIPVSIWCGISKVTDVADEPSR